MIPTKSVLPFSPNGPQKACLGFRIHPSCHPRDGSALADGSTVKNNLGKRNGHHKAPTIEWLTLNLQKCWMSFRFKLFLMS